MASEKRGIVYLVGGGPGDPGLITLRGVQCLERAEVVIYDRLVNPLLLSYAPQAEWIDVGKEPKRHTIPQAEINALLVEMALQGKTVVRLKGGDPFLFGRGGEEAAAVAERGIPFEIVPGVTSAIAAPAYAGIPVTHRGQACSVTFITGHRADFCDDPESGWQRAARGADTLVFLMGVGNLARIVEQVLAGGRSPSTPTALIAQGTCPEQRTVTGTLADIVERSASIQPPAVIVIGDVAGLQPSLEWYDRPGLRTLCGRRILVPRLPNTRGPEPFSLELLAQGAEPVELPAPEFKPLGSLPLTALTRSEYDWILFPDGLAVEYFIDLMVASGCDGRLLAGVKLAAAGAWPAEALHHRSFHPDFCLPVSPTETLDIPPGLRVLFPCDGTGNRKWAAALEAHRARVDSLHVYSLRAPEPAGDVLTELQDGSLDALALPGPAAVKALEPLLVQDGWADLLQRLPAACLDLATAEYARSIGLQGEVIEEYGLIRG